LIILGGLGFPVISSLLDWRMWRQRGLKGGLAFLPVHTRVVLATTAALLFGGALCFLLLEWSHSLAPLPFWQRPLASLFQSAAFRTAGFATVDFTKLGGPMLLLGMALMFIGAAPGGTAGGVKVTTIAVLALTFRALWRRRPEVEVMGRTLLPSNVYRAAAVALISLGLVFALTVLLVAVEPTMPTRDLLFEAVSAFSTTGLSTGVTPSFSGPGQVLLCLMMFIGRLGPFTFALALAISKAEAPYTFPSTKIVVG
jgi:trk system potassium uptake protein TrkH